MRLPPVWVAILTVSATLNLPNSVNGQTVNALASAPDNSGAQSETEVGITALNELWKLSALTEKTDSQKPNPQRPSDIVEVSEIEAVIPASEEAQPSIQQQNLLYESKKEDKLGDFLENTNPDISEKTANRDLPSTLNLFPINTRIPSSLFSQGTSEQPPTTPAPVAPPPRTQPTNQCPDPNAPQVLIAEVVVKGVEGPLLDEVYRSIRTQPGRTTNRCQLQEDVNAIFALGQFASVDYLPEDTPLGVRVTFLVQQNPVLRNVVVSVVPAGEGKQVTPQNVVDEIFSPQYGQTLNLRRFQEGVKRLNQWYKDNGYILAQVVGSSPVDANGTVTLQVAEGIIEDIQVRFLNKEGEDTDKEGRAIQGRTRKFIITREMVLKPGDVLQESTLIGDLRRIFALGIFEKVEPTLNPGQDPRKVVVVLNVTERRTGSVAAGAGISSATGLFGTVSYQEQNLGGNNQKVGAQLQVGERALLFDVSFTDPWIAGDPFRTSYTVNGFRRRSLSLVYTGGDNEVKLPNGDRPRILRFGGGVTFTRPLGPAPLDTEWKASLGFEYQRVTIRDIDGKVSPKDELGNDLSWSGEGKDDLLSLQFGIARDLRDNPLKPTKGSVLRFSSEQFLPIGLGSIFGNRLRGSYSYYIPVQYFRFAKGPQTLAFNVQAGTFIGDLPPYEAFALGGSNSVRGWDEGELGSGRSFLQATVEYRFPLFSVVGGALFFDVASDLGSGSSVLGDPAGVRGKPGSGFGYGLGVRVDSPLGPIRVDYGFNNEGGSRFHFGIGERF
ncbi:MAG: BamA/TamA family outer membrane protein [Oscillatoriaceae bacterium SKW80]|nr:BamA/TamA family outer membrane protein [Oscillatoriaceae bacterium SKYG93]MCX8120547.1 BamA/TamA family outer membrane protein [Oscillatoriaceae bacterium SKW80]MDW8452785.1 BamA/TamA family outer membrane protein [Oscillatoriaceae cyanobacterium SKYGB_i_bin93]HIK27145.1 BamA/TamA family outer membrane protein [Oscillatoriaceae cyanobacterium M7585_C2015_266]